jgi:hypothetical protein
VNCANCGNSIPEARQLALPGETWCRDCVEADGDVERVRGAMTWEHKTAPTLVLGHAADIIRGYDRRGFHAALPMNSPNNPRMQASAAKQQDLKDLRSIMREEETPAKTYDDVPRARCHPDRPKVGTSGKCYECAVKWYEERARVR